MAAGYEPKDLFQLVAAADVGKLGLAFHSLPPGHVAVKSVGAGSWGEQHEIFPGDLLIEAQGKDLKQVSKDEFRDMISQQRPLTLIFYASEPSAASPGEPATETRAERRSLRSQGSVAEPKQANQPSQPSQPSASTKEPSQPSQTSAPNPPSQPSQPSQPQTQPPQRKEEPQQSIAEESPKEPPKPKPPEAQPHQPPSSKDQAEGQVQADQADQAVAKAPEISKADVPVAVQDVVKTEAVTEVKEGPKTSSEVPETVEPVAAVAPVEPEPAAPPVQPLEVEELVPEPTEPVPTATSVAPEVPGKAPENVVREEAVAPPSDHPDVVEKTPVPPAPSEVTKEAPAETEEQRRLEDFGQKGDLQHEKVEKTEKPDGATSPHAETQRVSVASRPSKGRKSSTEVSGPQLRCLLPPTISG